MCTEFFSPKIKGTLFLEDKYTVRFEPDEPLESQQNYTAKLALDKLFKVDESLKTFDFQFQHQLMTSPIPVSKLEKR